jgi:hypothetical protein
MEDGLSNVGSPGQNGEKHDPGTCRIATDREICEMNVDEAISRKSGNCSLSWISESLSRQLFEIRVSKRVSK